MHLRLPTVATFSIVGRDAATGELGVAVQSRFLAVGAVVTWAKADVGAVATQAWANTAYGPEGLDLIARGMPAAEAVARLTELDAGREHRQLGVVDHAGRAAAHTGARCLPWCGHRTGPNFACQGNVLRGRATLDALADTFMKHPGHLADRLLAALAAGQAAGGDSRGQQSAALLVVRAGGGYGGFSDRLVDLRADDHPQPIAELYRLLELHRQTFLTPTPPDRWQLDNPEKVSLLQALLREIGVFDGSVSGELTYNTRGALDTWCRQHGFKGLAADGLWLPGVTIRELRRMVTDSAMPQL